MRLASFILVFLLVLVLVDGRLFCFRRLKKKNKCGGYLRREKYTSPEACCSGKGQGFADRKVKFGRNRFQCLPCSSILSIPPVVKEVAAGTTSTTTETPTTISTTTTTTTTTTTEFFWPAPAARDYAIAPPYPPPMDDDGNLIVWEAWSPCSMSCGAGWRSRAKACDGCDRNDYENVQSQPCMVNFYCPVDGNWGPWYPWQSCSSSCSGGVRIRQRKCNYPPPAYGGAECAGDAVAEQPCNRKECPVDGNWGEWSAFSECSATCGPGFSKRTRACDSPIPDFGGKDCEGPDSYTQKCEIIRCPVDGAWSLWGTWSHCSATCGRGIRERSRSCDSPRPQHGGQDCDGAAKHQEECYGGRPCPVDGEWSMWTSYGYCRAPRCSQGYQIRSRSCNSPSPAHGGKPCVGQQYERVVCYNDHDCPRDGSWCAWGPWNQCTSSCRETSSIQGRQRICACPSPKNGGIDCQGDSFEVQECTDLPYCEIPAEHKETSEEGVTYDEEQESETDAHRITDRPVQIQDVDVREGDKASTTTQST